LRVENTHDLFAATDSSYRQAAADDLAQGKQIGFEAVLP
jgi:hypothetical protein